MSNPPAKKARTEDYVLYYWPGIPGRGEYVRLAFEHAGIPYTENHGPADSNLIAFLGRPDARPPHFAPPALQLPSGRVLSQTAAILNHIAPRFGLAGERGNTLRGAEAGLALTRNELLAAEEERSAVNQLVQTALDLQNETHDTHHPVSNALFYEDQKAEAARRAEDFRATRIPRFFAHFQAVLKANGEGKGTHLVGARTTTADLVLFQVVDGLLYAFPKRLAALREGGEYAGVFALHARVAGEKGIKEYLASDRRKEYSMGIFRHYEELDGEK